MRVVDSPRQPIIVSLVITVFNNTVAFLINLLPCACLSIDPEMSGCEINKQQGRVYALSAGTSLRVEWTKFCVLLDFSISLPPCTMFLSRRRMHEGYNHDNRDRDSRFGNRRTTLRAVSRMCPNVFRVLCLNCILSALYFRVEQSVRLYFLPLLFLSESLNRSTVTGNTERSFCTRNKNLQLQSKTTSHRSSLLCVTFFDHGIGKVNLDKLQMLLVHFCGIPRLRSVVILCYFLCLYCFFLFFLFT